MEREISFRTEQGLYYSYYKHLTNAESLSQGILELEKDNLTEHLNTINIWQRFNIYQELALAAVYKVRKFSLRLSILHSKVYSTSKASLRSFDAYSP